MNKKAVVLISLVFYLITLDPVAAPPPPLSATSRAPSGRDPSPSVDDDDLYPTLPLSRPDLSREMEYTGTRGGTAPTKSCVFSV
jgi:hypothetical protein